MKNQEIQLDKLPSLEDLWCSQCLGYTRYDVNCRSWSSDSGGGVSTHYNCKECKGEMYSPEYSLTVMDNGSPNIVYIFVIIGLLVAYPSAGVNGLLGFAAFCIVMLGIFKWSRMMVFNKYNIWANHVFATYGNSYLKHITRKQFDNYILSHIQSRKSREKTKQISWADRKKIWFENYSSGYAFFAMIFGILSVTIILSPFALLFGILGLIQSKRRNEASGVKRSLFGIVMGIIFLVILIHNIIF